MSNAGEDVELQEVSFIAVGNAEWHSHFGRHRHFLIKLNTLLPHYQDHMKMRVEQNSILISVTHAF